MALSIQNSGIPRLLGVWFLMGLVFLPLATAQTPSGKKTPIPESDAYKTDPDYREIYRYDYLPYWLNREKELRLENGEKGEVELRKQDRSLVLAGPGFKIPDLQRFEPEPSLELNPYLHIERRDYRPQISVPGDQLDPDLEKVGSARELVFRPKVSGFYNVPAPEVHLEEPPAPKAKPPLATVPESRLLLSNEGETELSLAPAPQSWDLLRGNEIENLREYYRGR